MHWKQEEDLEEDDFVGHSGLLADDAPALYSDLRSRAAPEDLAALSRIYGLVFEAGGTDESGHNRPEGANFNPRPARLCRIIINEERDLTVTTLAAAMLCCIPGSKRPKSLPGLEEALALAADSTGNSCSAAERITLAALLDELRHLHMSKGGADEIETVTKRAELLLSTNSTENARLKTLVKASLERRERQAARQKKAPK